MDPIIFILLAAALIAVAFYLVALPLLQHARRNAAPTTEYSSEQERLDELLAQREAAFQALRELNFDHRVGKITDEDFVAFEAGLKQHAANTLRALDAWEAEADDDLDLTMEAEIEARRQALAGRGNGHAVEAVGAPCPTCGKPTATGDRFCASCGTDLAGRVVAPKVDDTRACPACGAEYLPGDRFCGKCGQPLAAEPVAAR